MQFDWFLSVLEQKWLENHEIYYIGAAEWHLRWQNCAPLPKGDQDTSSLRSNIQEMVYSDAGRWKILEGPVVIGGDNLPSPVRIGLTDLPNIGGASGPPGPPGSGITDNKTYQDR